VLSRWSLAGAALAVLLLSGSGCGFQLRSWQLGNGYESVGLDVRGGFRSARGGLEMAEQLGRALEQTGVPVLTSGAELVLELIDSDEELRTASVSGTARTAEYELIQRVRYAVRTADGGYVAPPATARASRRYFLDRGNLVGSNEEQSLLRRELRAELVQRVMRVLNTVSRNPASSGGAGG